MPRYAEVNWEKAACRGAPTNLFYIVEENHRAKEFLNLNVLRTMCFACPIWRDCASYAFKHERDGLWGGLTTNERRAFVTGEPSSLYNKVLTELNARGVSWEEMQEVIDEHTSYERSVANEASD
jgi:hypothetical protein